MSEPKLLRHFTINSHQQISGLSKAINEARNIKHINAQLKQVLPAPFDVQLYLVRLVGDCAFFSVSSPAMAFRANQQKALLLKYLKNLTATKHIKKIVINIL